MKSIVNWLAPRAWTLPMIVIATAPVALLAFQQPEALRLDDATLKALRTASAGTYVVANGALRPATDDAAVPVLVQADAYRRTQGRITVPLVVAAEVVHAWAMHIDVIRPGQPASQRASTVADESISGAPGVLREIRELTLVPGSYETTVVIAYRGNDGNWIGTVVKSPLVVPDLWSTQLTATPIVLGATVVTVRPEERGRPFTFGATGLTPAVFNRFRQDDSLHTAFRIYGWKGDESARPDLSIEYVFYQQVGDRLRFFNKSKPQSLNPETLGPTFDGASGVATAGISMPLVSFPAGEFELTVRVLDKRTKSSATKKVRFFVVT